MGPSGPIHKPDGMDIIMPNVFASIVLNDVNEVGSFVSGLTPPEGITPFKSATRPGMPEAEAEGQRMTQNQATVHKPIEDPVQINQPHAKLYSSLHAS
jgi:hypothetical protein